MWKNYFKISVRNIRKQRGYAFINIFGLFLGILCCLLIGLWVHDELNFDGFHEKAARIRRVQVDINFGGAEMAVATVCDPLGPTVVAEYAQVEAACRFRHYGSMSVRHGTEVFMEERVLFADASVFQVFTFPLSEGNPATALAEPNTVVLSERTAKKYFGNRSPLGELLSFNEKRWEARVAGVMRDIPANSHIQADFFLSMPSLEESKAGNWVSNNFNTYLLFREGADYRQLEKDWPAFARRHIGPVVQQLLGSTWADFEKNGNRLDFSTIALGDIHLKGGNRMADISPNSSLDMVRVMTAIGLFILLLAMVNFMNLSTARAAGRAREVGVQKVMGSGRMQLMGQFMTESVLMSLLAGVPALLVARGLLPAFNQLADKKIALNFWQDPAILCSTLLFVLLAGLLAGIYPAFVLSAFRPVQALKGAATTGRGSAWLRSGLVTVQFGISVVMIISALVTWQQMYFIQNKNLGFERSQVLVLNNAFSAGEKLKVFKAEAAQLAGVESATISGFLPTNGNHNDQAYFKGQDFSAENSMSLNDWYVDTDYLKTLKIDLVSGRNFDPISPADTNAIIVNRSAAKLLGYPDPLDKEIFTFADVDNKRIQRYKIIGMVEDFHYESLRNRIAPLILHRTDMASSISFRLSTDDISGTVHRLKEMWQAQTGNLLFDYDFMDEQFDNLYRSEQRAGSLAFLFACLAIVIACMGLFGLAAYSAQQRTKEIGIRKVLGASVLGLTGLLARDFLKLVLLAIVIASPVAFYFMNQWLANFAYRIDMHIWTFVAAGIFATAIAFLTVGGQAVKAALSNPVKSLRSE